jgi:threo-3-hydroxy-L-aspartate ammonia-lyase
MIGLSARTVTLDDIQRAAERIQPHALRTPLLRQLRLEPTLGADLYLKAENLQRVGAFKFRGAYNTLSTLAETERSSHVITSSSGNHGQAVAAAGGLLGIDVTVVMPENAVHVKIDAVRGYGAQVEFAGTTSPEREARAQEIGAQTGGVVIGSFDDTRIIAGQGTAGLEIMQQLPDVQVIVVPVGGGGLISGVATAAKAIKPGIRVIGVEPEGAADVFESLKSGRRVTLSRIDTIADGLRTSSPGELNFAIMSRLVDQIVLITDDEIRAAMRALAFVSKLTVEPSGAVAVAALISGKIDVAGQKVVAVISGGNVDPNMYAGILAASE